jgi:hypothetical protein
VVKVFVTGFFSNFFFKFVDRTGGFDGFDTSTLGANEVISVTIGELFIQ